MRQLRWLEEVDLPALSNRCFTAVWRRISSQPDGYHDAWRLAALVPRLSQLIPRLIDVDVTQQAFQ